MGLYDEQIHHALNRIREAMYPINMMVDEDALRVWYASATVSYIGYAEKAGTLGTTAKWKIKRITQPATSTTVGETKIEYADGSKAYTRVWDDGSGNIGIYLSGLSYS